MPDDPADVLDALDRAEDVFGGYATGPPRYEENLDPEVNEPPVIQLRKACRLLDACRVLREYDGFHTSVIEMLKNRMFLASRKSSISVDVICCNRAYA